MANAATIVNRTMDVDLLQRTFVERTFVEHTNSLFREDEDSDDYGAPVIMASAVADTIKGRTEEHLKKIQAGVSAKSIVMRAEYTHWPNLTIIDTPGFVIHIGPI